MTDIKLMRSSVCTDEMTVVYERNSETMKVANGLVSI